MQYSPVGVFCSHEVAPPTNVMETTSGARPTPHSQTWKDLSQPRAVHDVKVEVSSMTELEETSDLTIPSTADSSDSQVPSHLYSSDSSEPLSTTVPCPSDHEGDSEDANMLSVSCAVPTTGTSFFPSPLPTPAKETQSVANVQVPVLPLATCTLDCEPEQTESEEDNVAEVCVKGVADEDDSRQSKPPIVSVDKHTDDAQYQKGVPGYKHGQECKSTHGKGSKPSSKEVASAKKENTSQSEEKEKLTARSKALGDLNSDETLSSDDDWDETLLPPRRYAVSR